MPHINVDEGREGSNQLSELGVDNIPAIDLFQQLQSWHVSVSVGKISVKTSNLHFFNRTVSNDFIERTALRNNRGLYQNLSIKQNIDEYVQYIWATVAFLNLQTLQWQSLYRTSRHTSCERTDLQTYLSPSQYLNKECRRPVPKQGLTKRQALNLN